MASIFLLLIVGYGTKKLRILSQKDSAIINLIVVNLTLPAFIFVSVNQKAFLPSMVSAPIVGLVLEVAVMALAYLFARALKLDRRTTASLMLASAFGNTGYLGLPVVTAAFKGDHFAPLAAVMMDSFAMRILLCSAGVAVATCFAGSRFQWKSVLEFVKSPLFAAVIIALAFRQVHVPEFPMKAIEYMGAATVPLSMVSVGLNLSASSMRDYPVGFGVAIVLKMVMLPVLVYFGLRWLGVGGTVEQVAVLEMAMPTAVFTGVVAGRYGANERFVAGAIFLMTILSLVSIPLVLMLTK